MDRYVFECFATSSYIHDEEKSLIFERKLYLVGYNMAKFRKNWSALTEYRIRTKKEVREMHQRFKI